MNVFGRTASMAILGCLALGSNSASAAKGGASQPPQQWLPPASRNLAPEGFAIQSSTGWGGEPTRAIDGNRDGSWWSNSVTHTLEQSESWWEVDLGDSAYIEHIDLFNRTDCCADRLANFEVLVSNVPFVSTQWAPAHYQPGVSVYPVDGQNGASRALPIGRYGRYVRVQLRGTGYLSLAEVEVWGRWQAAGFDPFPWVSDPGRIVGVAGLGGERSDVFTIQRNGDLRAHLQRNPRATGEVYTMDGYGSGPSGIAAYRSGDGMQHLIVTTPRGDVEEHWFDERLRGGVASLAGMRGAVATAGFASTLDGRQHVFVLTDDGYIHEIHYVGGQGITVQWRRFFFPNTIAMTAYEDHEGQHLLLTTAWAVVDMRFNHVGHPDREPQYAYVREGSFVGAGVVSWTVGNALVLADTDGQLTRVDRVGSTALSETPIGTIAAPASIGNAEHRVVIASHDGSIRAVDPFTGAAEPIARYDRQSAAVTEVGPSLAAPPDIALRLGSCPSTVDLAEAIRTRLDQTVAQLAIPPAAADLLASVDAQTLQCDAGGALVGVWTRGDHRPAAARTLGMAEAVAIGDSDLVTLQLRPEFLRGLALEVAGDPGRYTTALVRAVDGPLFIDRHRLELDGTVLFNVQGQYLIDAPYGWYGLDLYAEDTLDIDPATDRVQCNSVFRGTLYDRYGTPDLLLSSLLPDRIDDATGLGCQLMPFFVNAIDLTGDGVPEPLRYTSVDVLPDQGIVAGAGL